MFCKQKQLTIIMQLGTEYTKNPNVNRLKFLVLEPNDWVIVVSCEDINETSDRATVAILTNKGLFCDKETIYGELFSGLELV